MAELDAILSKWTNAEQNYMQGLSFVAYDKSGKCIYLGAQGNRTVDRSSDIPARVDDLYYLASQTKLITSVAVMQIIEKGLIGLDDDCGKIVPQLANKDIIAGFEGDESQTNKAFDAATNLFTFTNPRKPILKKAKKPITLRLLLSHTSGFVYTGMSADVQEYLTSIGETVSSHASMENYNTPLIYEPGDSWAYGPSIDWAGRVLEAVTGQTLDEYLQENICTKLGMKNTTFFPDARLDSLPPQMELGVKPEGPKGKMVKGHETMFTSRPSADCLGGIGLYSTCEDYGLFLKAIVSGGAPLLKRESLDKLFTGTVANRQDLQAQVQGILRPFMCAELLPDTEVDYSLGGLVNLTAVPGRRAEGSVKWSGMTNPMWWVDLKTGVAGAIFAQILPPGDPLVSECLVELEAEVYQKLSRASL